MIAFVLLRVFVILLLVAANAFFAAAEFALVSVRETRILQLIEAHRVGARIVLKLHQQLRRVVNGVQLGITITSLYPGLAGRARPRAPGRRPGSASIPHAILYAHAIAVGVAFVMHHHPARDPRRTRSEVASPPASRACRAGRSRAHGLLPDRHRPGNDPHEPRRRLRPASLWDQRNPPWISPLPRRTQPDRHRGALLRPAFLRPGRDAAQRARTGQHHRPSGNGARAPEYFPCPPT